MLLYTFSLGLLLLFKQTGTLFFSGRLLQGPSADRANAVGTGAGFTGHRCRQARVPSALGLLDIEEDLTRAALRRRRRRHADRATQRSERSM